MEGEKNLAVNSTNNATWNCTNFYSPFPELLFPFMDKIAKRLFVNFWKNRYNSIDELACFSYTSLVLFSMGTLDRNEEQI